MGREHTLRFTPLTAVTSLSCSILWSEKAPDTFCFLLVGTRKITKYIDEGVRKIKYSLKEMFRLQKSYYLIEETGASNGFFWPTDGFLGGVFALLPDAKEEFAADCNCIRELNY